MTKTASSDTPESSGTSPDGRAAQAWEKTKQASVAAAQDTSRHLLTRYRRQLAPLATIAGTYVLGLAATVTSAFGALAALAPLGVGAVAAAAASVRAARQATPAGRTYTAAAAAAATGWLGLATVIGPGGWMTWTLWLGGYTLAVPYWARLSDPDPDITAERAAPPPPPPAPPQQTQAPDWRAARWGTYLGHKGDLEESRLTDIEGIAHGWRAVVSQPRGQHWHTVMSQINRISSVFDLPDGRAMVERIEGAPVHKSRLTVLESNPLEQVTYWPGPGLDPDDGTFPFALTADGQTLPFRLWWPGAGTCHTLISGTTGSGKSACLNIILSEIAASDRLYPVLIDGNGGMSIPDWLEHAPQTATTFEDAMAQLRWVEQVRSDRARKLARTPWTDDRGRQRRGLNSIDPTPDMPGIVVVIDEGQNLLKDQQWGKQFRAVLEPLAQMGRKTAIHVIIVTQQPSVTELGGSSLLRNMLKSGNVVAFRTADRVAGGMVVDTPLPEGLHQLPQQWPDGSPTQGLCYVLTQRSVRARTWLNPDPYDYAELLPAKPRSLDPAAATVAVPTTATPTPTPPAGGLRVVTGHEHDNQPPGGDEIAQRIQDALARGTPAEPVALMQATGLPLSAARRAVAALNVD